MPLKGSSAFRELRLLRARGRSLLSILGFSRPVFSFLATSVFLHTGWSQCLSIPSAQSVRAHTSYARHACFLVNVNADAHTQLSVDQPVDLAIRITAPEPAQVVDGFEFGQETLTILLPGSYRIEVSPVKRTSRTWNFSMSRRDLPLQDAQTWRKAEDAGTSSKTSQAVLDLSQSLELWKATGDAASIARTYLKQGDASYNSNDFAAARNEYEDALSICEPLGDIRCAAEAANNTGLMESLLADFEAASRRLQEAVKYFGQIQRPEDEGRSRSNLGLLFRQAGDYGAALRNSELALQILRGRNPTAYALVLNNLGLCYQFLSENQKAIAYFQSALASHMARNETDRVLRPRLNLGRSYMLLGLLSDAQRSLDQALREAKSLSDLPGQADVLVNLGQLSLRRGRSEEARLTLNQALAIYQQLHGRKGEGSAVHYLGVAASALNNIPEARQQFTEAIKIRRESGLRDDASESIYALAELEFRDHNPDVARKLVNEAISQIETLRSGIPSPSLRANYYARKRRLFDLLTEIAMTGPQDPTAGFLAAEQACGRAHLDLISGGAASGTVPPELLERRNGIRSQIDLLAFRLAAPERAGLTAEDRRQRDRERDQLRSRIEILLGEAEQADSEIQQAANTSLGRPLASAADLQSALPEDGAVLEYHLGPRESYLWIVRKHEEIQAFRLPSRGAIEAVAFRTVERFQKYDVRRNTQTEEGAKEQSAFETDLRHLSDMLLGSLAKRRLPRQLILVLDGVLNRVPMAALQPGWARQPLGLTHDLIQSPSSAFLLAAKPPKRVAAFPRSVLAIADPVFSADDPRVHPNAKAGPSASGPRRILFLEDVKKLKAILPANRLRVLQDFDASPGTLWRASPQSYAILHFSTHSFIDDGIPELSRVALSLVDRSGGTVDGNLKPQAFANFRLDRSIVVLSSCETGLGKEVIGEGLAGFSSSLFSAGASQLVLTIAKVDAEASATFFAEVYSVFFKTPSGSMEHALTEARKTLANDSRWKDPFYWASIVMVGAPSEPGTKGTKSMQE
jgi:CHAT domain-containing protein/Tfp pilus assembly protein PilF